MNWGTQTRNGAVPRLSTGLFPPQQDGKLAPLGQQIAQAIQGNLAPDPAALRRHRRGEPK